MTADEEYALVAELLHDNEGCQLPCWWSFVPGETSWQTTKTFFASLGKKMWEEDEYPDTYYVFFHIRDHYHYHHQEYRGQAGTLDEIYVRASPPDEDGYPAYGDPRFTRDWESYLLPRILLVYGQPQQVLLETYSNGPDRLPFRLLLFYPNQSFLVLYEGFTGEEGRGWSVEAEQAIHVCPWRSDVSLWLWSPEREMTLSAMAPMIEGRVIVDHSRSLEEATGMSLEQFYETFLQPDNQTCLETPADLW